MSIQFKNSRFNRSYLSKVAGNAVSARALAAGNGSDGARPELSGGAAAPGRPRGRTLDKGASVLEACHPEIVRSIELLWGFPEMNDYFDRLWMADDAQGPIEPDAMSELMLLSRLHQIIIPQRPNRTMASIYGSNRMHETPGTSGNPWSDIPPRR
jgi:hypothetical protein